MKHHHEQQQQHQQSLRRTRRDRNIAIVLLVVVGSRLTVLELTGSAATSDRFPIAPTISSAITPRGGGGGSTYYTGPDSSLEKSIRNNEYQLPQQYRDGQPPSLDRPFIFFHQRKAAGSVVRDHLEDAAQRIAGEGGGTTAKTYIPCVSKVTHLAKLACETYYTPQELRRAADTPTIYGGHLYYAGFQRTLYLLHAPRTSPATSANSNNGIPAAGEDSKFATANIKKQVQDKHVFTCLTIFREPLARIQSCWNYRMVQQLPQYPKLSEIPAANMTELLSTALSLYGEGCLNEPIRLFGDNGDNEWVVNHQLLLHLPHSASVAKRAVEQTLERASRCVVGILERCEDTQKAIQKHLPWLAPHFVDYCNQTTTTNTGSTTRQLQQQQLLLPHHRHLSVNIGKVEKGTLTAEQKEVMLNLTIYEDHIYTMANRILDAQIQ